MADHVTVACKLPGGLNLGPAYADSNGNVIVLAGSFASGAVGGHGITSHVEKDVWDRWREDHKDFMPVKKGFIFAHDRTSMTMGQAEERKAETNGMEPLAADPTKDARAPRPGPGVVVEGVAPPQG